MVQQPAITRIPSFPTQQTSRKLLPEKMSALNIDITLNTGAKIPAVGFGTVCDEEFRYRFKDALKVAILEAGYRHIDTAWYYGTEKLIGEVLSELIGSIGKNQERGYFRHHKSVALPMEQPTKVTRNFFEGFAIGLRGSVITALAACV